MELGNVGLERGKSEYQEKNLSEQRREPSECSVATPNVS